MLRTNRFFSGLIISRIILILFRTPIIPLKKKINNNPDRPKSTVNFFVSVLIALSPFFFVIYKQFHVLLPDFLQKNTPKTPHKHSIHRLIPLFMLNVHVILLLFLIYPDGSPNAKLQPLRPAIALRASINIPNDG
jgi:hypothetical protein